MKKILIALLAIFTISAANTAGTHNTAADVYFRFDKSDLTPVAGAILDSMRAKIEEPRCVRIRIVGHTCELGTEEYNNGLGLRRAEVVRDELVRMGFDFDKIAVETVGSSDPIVKYDPADSHDKAIYIQNRVAEVYILPRISWRNDFKCKQDIKNENK